MRIPFAEGQSLEGLLDLPDGASLRGRSAVLLCHPHPAFGGRMNNPLLVALARGFVDAGLAALRIHYRGIEGSDGEPTGGWKEHEDVGAATRFLLEGGAARVAWVGYSFGALMALRCIAAGARPFAYVGIALPTSIIGDDPTRIADVLSATAAPVPGLFLGGEHDTLCDGDKVRGWLAQAGRMQFEQLAGEGHVFSSEAEREVAGRTIAFVRRAMGEEGLP